MKVKITAKGYNTLAETIAVNTIETCITKDEFGLDKMGKILYAIENTGFVFNTHNVFSMFVSNISKIDTSKLTTRYLPIVDDKFDHTKITISVGKN